MGIFTLPNGHKMEIFIQSHTVTHEAESRPALLRSLVEANGGLCVEKGQRTMVFVIVDCKSPMAVKLVGKNSVEDPSHGCDVGVVWDAWVEDCIRKHALLDDDTDWGGHYIRRTEFYPKQPTDQVTHLRGFSHPASRLQPPPASPEALVYPSGGTSSVPSPSFPLPEMQQTALAATTSSRSAPEIVEQRTVETPQPKLDVSQGASSSSTAMKRGASEASEVTRPRKQAHLENPVDISLLSFTELRGGEGIQHEQKGKFTASERAALVTFMRSNPHIFQRGGPAVTVWEAFAREIRSERGFTAWRKYFSDHKAKLKAQAASKGSLNADDQ